MSDHNCLANLASSEAVIVLAASARALAASLSSVQSRVIAIDFFGDVDLAAIAEQTHRIQSASDAMSIVDRLPADWPLVYGGAFENRPDLLDAVRERRRVIGCVGEDLRRVRDRGELATVLHTIGVTMPRSQDSRPSNSENWLWKPTRSGSGFGIGPAAQQDDGYWQRHIGGVSLGLQFVSIDGRCRFLGACEQRPRSPGQPYFCRDLKHVRVNDAAVLPIGERIVDAFRIVGPFGVDVIRVSPRETPEAFVVLECNPRYTAGMELWERLHDRSVFQHAGPEQQSDRDAVDRTRGFNGTRGFDGTRGFNETLCKRVVIAPHTGTSWLPAELPGLIDDDSNVGPAYADIPPVGSRINAGQPFCTVFGSTFEQCGDVERAVLTKLGPPPKRTNT